MLRRFWCNYRGCLIVFKMCEIRMISGITLVVHILTALPVPLALPVQRALPALLAPRRQSFMRNASDSFSAGFAELLLVVLYVLCNTAVLVCIIKFDFDALILMDIDCVDKLHQQAAG